MQHSSESIEASVNSEPVELSISRIQRGATDTHFAARIEQRALKHPPVLEEATTFENCLFEKLTLKRVHSKVEITFKNCIFLDAVKLEDWQCRGFLRFQGCDFANSARFVRMSADTVEISQCVFQGVASFNGAEFCGESAFSDVTFEKEARFQGATFRGNVLFSDCRFQGQHLLDQATKKKDSGPDCHGHLIFERCGWRDRFSASALKVRGLLHLLDCLFADEVSFSWAALGVENATEAAIPWVSPTGLLSKTLGEERLKALSSEQHTVRDTTFQGPMYFWYSSVEKDFLWDSVTWEGEASLGDFWKETTRSAWDGSWRLTNCQADKRFSIGKTDISGIFECKDSSFHGEWNGSGSVFKGECAFIGCEFTGLVNLGNTPGKSAQYASFHGPVDFVDCRVMGTFLGRKMKLTASLSLENCNFTDLFDLREAELRECKLRDVDFQHDARFHKAQLYEGLDCRYVTFQRKADFSQATFHKSAQFGEPKLTKDEQKHLVERALHNEGQFATTFRGMTYFNDATFHDLADFSECIFYNKVSWDGAHWGRKTGNQGMHDFKNAKFYGDVSFRKVRIEAYLNFSTDRTDKHLRHGSFFGRTVAFEEIKLPEHRAPGKRRNIGLYFNNVVLTAPTFSGCVLDGLYLYNVKIGDPRSTSDDPLTEEFRQRLQRAEISNMTIRKEFHLHNCTIRQIKIDLSSEGGQPIDIRDSLLEEVIWFAKDGQNAECKQALELTQTTLRRCRFHQLTMRKKLMLNDCTLENTTFRDMRFYAPLRIENSEVFCGRKNPLFMGSVKFPKQSSNANSSGTEAPHFDLSGTTLRNLHLESCEFQVLNLTGADITACEFRDVKVYDEIIIRKEPPRQQALTLYYLAQARQSKDFETSALEESLDETPATMSDQKEEKLLTFAEFQGEGDAAQLVFYQKGISPLATQIHMSESPQPEEATPKPEKELGRLPKAELTQELQILFNARDSSDAQTDFQIEWKALPDGAFEPSDDCFFVGFYNQEARQNNTTAEQAGIPADRVILIHPGRLDPVRRIRNRIKKWYTSVKMKLVLFEECDLGLSHQRPTLPDSKEYNNLKEPIERPRFEGLTINSSKVYLPLFQKALFFGDIVLEDRCTLQAAGLFQRSEFHGPVVLRDSTLHSKDCFEGAEFHHTLRLEELDIGQQLSLENASVTRDLILKRLESKENDPVLDLRACQLAGSLELQELPGVGRGPTLSESDGGWLSPSRQRARQKAFRLRLHRAEIQRIKPPAQLLEWMDAYGAENQDHLLGQKPTGASEAVEASDFYARMSISCLKADRMNEAKELLFWHNEERIRTLSKLWSAGDFCKQVEKSAFQAERQTRQHTTDGSEKAITKAQPKKAESFGNAVSNAAAILRLLISRYYYRHGHQPYLILGWVFLLSILASFLYLSFGQLGVIAALKAAFLDATAAPFTAIFLNLREPLFGTSLSNSIMKKLYHFHVLGNGFLLIHLLGLVLPQATKFANLKKLRAGQKKTNTATTESHTTS